MKLQMMDGCIDRIKRIRWIKIEITDGGTDGWVVEWKQMDGEITDDGR